MLDQRDTELLTELNRIQRTICVWPGEYWLDDAVAASPVVGKPPSEFEVTVRRPDSDDIFTCVGRLKSLPVTVDLVGGSDLALRSRDGRLRWRTPATADEFRGFWNSVSTPAIVVYLEDLKAAGRLVITYRVTTSDGRFHGNPPKQERVAVPVSLNLRPLESSGRAPLPLVDLIWPQALATRADAYVSLDRYGESLSREIVGEEPDERATYPAYLVIYTNEHGAVGNDAP